MDEREWLTNTDPRAMLEYLQQPRYKSFGRVTGGPFRGAEMSIAMPLATDRKLRLWCHADWLLHHSDDYEHSWAYFEKCGLQEEIDQRLWLQDQVPAKMLNAASCALLRDIFGNPFRPVVLPVSYSRASCPNAGLTPTVLAVAQTIYTERRFEDMPILADALEEAGCDNEDLLNHCRGLERCPDCFHSGKNGHRHRHGKHGPGYYECQTCEASMWMPLRGPHVRGCHVVDLILGKD